MATQPLRHHLIAYASALTLASASEALLVALLGGERIVADAARAVAAGLLLVALLDLAFLLARRAEPRFSAALGLLLGGGLLLVPGPVHWFERIALAPEPPPPAGPRPAVTLLTGLPLLWGEADPLAGQPSAVWRRLAAEFAPRPIDAVTPAALAQAPLLLAAQPRELAPAEIDALDRWLRGGGRALLLADPDLRWPSELPPGDARRPPRHATLAPLLARWGVTVARGTGGIATLDLPGGGGRRRRIIVDAPGLLRAGPACRLLGRSHAADCRIGRGRALILADADLLDDRLWVAPGPHGATRLARGGDNALLVAEWLDRLANNRRERAADSVSWRRPGSPAWAIVAAALPGLLLALLGLDSVRRIRRCDGTLSHRFIHRNKAGRTAETRGADPPTPPT